MQKSFLECSLSKDHPIETLAQVRAFYKEKILGHKCEIEVAVNSVVGKEHVADIGKMGLSEVEARHTALKCLHE